MLLTPWEEFFLSTIKDLPIDKASVPSVDPDTKKKVLLVHNANKLTSNTSASLYIHEMKMKLNQHYAMTGRKGPVSSSDEEQRSSIPGLAWLLQF